MLGIINVFGNIIRTIKNNDQIRISIEKNKYIFSNQSLVNTINTIALVGIAIKNTNKNLERGKFLKSKKQLPRQDSLNQQKHR